MKKSYMKTNNDFIINESMIILVETARNAVE